MGANGIKGREGKKKTRNRDRGLGVRYITGGGNSQKKKSCNSKCWESKYVVGKYSSFGGGEKRKEGGQKKKKEINGSVRGQVKSVDKKYVTGIINLMGGGEDHNEGDNVTGGKKTLSDHNAWMTGA